MKLSAIQFKNRPSVLNLCDPDWLEVQQEQADGY